MEGQVRQPRSTWRPGAALILALSGMPAGSAVGQITAPAVPAAAPEISLRKSVKVLKYQGREVEGEDRQIARGDSLWRILVEEKGVSGKNFRSYVVIIRDLNPHLKNLDFLRVGDRLFIPLRPAGLLEDAPAGDAGAAPRSVLGTTFHYRVRTGEHLYQILRDQLKLTEDRKVAQYYALVRDLNPERKNWDALVEGEVIRLPVVGQVAPVPEADVPIAQADFGAEKKVTPESPPGVAPSGKAEAQAVGEPEPIAEAKPAVIVAGRDVLKWPAKENLALLGKVAEAVGSQMRRTGEEVVALKDGAVRFDRSNYPVVFNPSLKQRVVLDPHDKIPAALRNKLGDPNIGAPIVAMDKGISVQDAVTQLLSGLGYQTLSTDRPVIIHQDGVTYEAKGNWMALAPEENSGAQQIFVISLSDDGVEVPQYLKVQLAKKGLHLKEVFLEPPTVAAPKSSKGDSNNILVRAKTWPVDKKEIVDSLLFAFGIPFGVAETLSVELQSGLRIDARTDRIFEQSGRRTALFFQRSDGEIRQALQTSMGIRMVELEIGSLSSRELIARMLNVLGDQTIYREHRFAAANGAARDRLTVTAWGFHLPERSLFITDRPIPVELHRFFFDKGLEIVYFQ